MPLFRTVTAITLLAITAGGLTLPAAPVKEREKGPLDQFRFVAFDGFDGKPGLNWQTIRADDTHLSYKSHPGQLTITTQKGTIHGAAEKADPGLPAKNIYVLTNPLAADANFVVTTCIVGFQPAASYHQAGLILYDDDDNYLKYVYQYNWRKGGGTCFALVNEQAGEPKHEHDDADPDATKVWLRLTRKGAKYEYATSTDGDHFTAHGTTEWAKDGPKKLGLIAKNGGDKEVPELEARFEFFELKAP